MQSPPLRLLESVNNLLRESLQDYIMMEQTLWLIGNLIGDNQGMTDLMIRQTKIFEVLTQLVH